MMRGGALGRCTIQPITAYGGSSRGMSSYNKRPRDNKDRFDRPGGNDRSKRYDSNDDFGSTPSYDNASYADNRRSSSSRSDQPYFRDSRGGDNDRRRSGPRGGSTRGNLKSTRDSYRQSQKAPASEYDDEFGFGGDDGGFEEERSGGSSSGYNTRRGSNSFGRNGGPPSSNRGQNTGPKAPTIKDFWIADVLYGVSPVLAALQSGRRKIHTLYLQEGLDAGAGSAGKRKDKSAVDTAVARAKELGAKIVPASKHDLNMVTDNRPHQGLVLDCSPLDFESLDAMPGMESLEGGKVPLWLCLDEVMDPQNFGAALRSAFFLGASGVLTCRRNSSPLSAVVSKASAGAMELAPVHSCRSLPQTLEDAKTKGWQIIGASAEDGAIPCSSFHLTQPSILVMGNEGYGLRTTVKRQCDVLLKIGGGEGAGMAAGQGIGGGGSRAGAHNLVDSLNVSVATGILLHDLLASRSSE